ncbi:MAG: carbohydrate ABC transporter permease [Clostridiales bacterium]|nr:carbohydrate ABC transporter permease [Clostridiales bacterium]
MRPMAQMAKRRANNTIRVPASDRALLAVNVAVLMVFTLTILLPLIYVLAASFSSAPAVVAGRVYLWPVDFSLDGFTAVFGSSQIGSGYLNSVFYMAAGTLFSLAATIMAAFPLSCKELYGRRVLMVFFTFTMMFSGGLIPTYLVVRDLRMTNTRWALLVPGALSVYYMIVARTYFQTTIPDELAEAADLDGCSDAGFLVRVVLPLSGPLIATLALFFAVTQWNGYFDALIYLNDQSKYPLQIVLRNILILNATDSGMISDVEALARRQGMKELLKFSLIVVASAPMLAIYPFVQKYFVRGIMIGAIKG